MYYYDGEVMLRFMSINCGSNTIGGNQGFSEIKIYKFTYIFTWNTFNADY